MDSELQARARERIQDLIFQLHVMDSLVFSANPLAYRVAYLSTPCNGFRAYMEEGIEGETIVILSTPCNGFCRLWESPRRSLLSFNSM